MAQKKNIKAQVNCDELLEKYLLFLDLMDQIPDVIYFKDRKGRLVFVNRAHAKGLNLKPQQVVGKTDFDFFSRERARMMAKDDRYVMDTGKPIIDKVERATRPDGIDNYVSTTKIPRFDKKGRVIGLIGITRDITRRVHLDSVSQEKTAIEKKLSVLEELNKLKSEFISTASHELRTPLAIIKEAIMLVFEELAGPVNEKQKEFLRKAADNIGRLGHLIEELLDISRIENNKIKLHYSLVNFSNLIREPLAFFNKMTEEKRITLKYDLPKEEVNIFMDVGKINQVITNLINNAIKFTEEDGSIIVELKILETKVRVGVIDTGIGIAKADLDRVFDKFMQISSASGLDRKGLGLGLAIARELVERHGGEIWAESKLGVGSKFYFTLPRFYTLNTLNKETRDRIKILLLRGIRLYLISLLIINYKEFKKRIKVSPDKLSLDLKRLIKTTLNEFYRKGKERPEITMTGFANGE
ncbi:MAG: ATP-binding protein, partial [bacterium]